MSFTGCSEDYGVDDLASRYSLAARPSILDTMLTARQASSRDLVTSIGIPSAYRLPTPAKALRKADGHSSSRQTMVSSVRRVLDSATSSRTTSSV